MHNIYDVQYKYLWRHSEIYSVSINIYGDMAAYRVYQHAVIEIIVLVIVLIANDRHLMPCKAKKFSLF